MSQQQSSQQQQSQQDALDEEGSRFSNGLHHTSSSASLPSGLATPIRLQHHRSSASRLQEFTGHGSSSSVLGDAWTTDGPASSNWRHLSSSPSRSRSRSSPHWSSESLLKDARWSEAPAQSAVAQQHDADREPFIPPPPLLDFETANLLPPLGVDVSSPSDDVHFVQPSEPPPPPPASSQPDWAHVPPQYATLRRPGRSQDLHYQAQSQSTSRRPSRHNPHQHLSSPSWMDAPDPHEPPGSVSSSSSSSCHRTDAVGRKCTCGQKMRLNHQQQQQQQESHIRSEDGLAGIATIRRPVKRKGRHPLPPSMQPASGSASSGQQAVTAAAAAALLQQPKLETSLLLDKLLRAGALRPEDYLVLSRMERMIMANHAASQSPNFAPTGRSNRSAKSSVSGPSVNSTPDYEAGRSHQIASNENLYDTGNASSIYGRRSSAGGPDMPLRQQAIQRPSPGPSPFDYYNAYGQREGSAQGAVPRASGQELSLYSYPQTASGPVQQGRCCPCCGSQSHPHVHHHCTLCGSEGHAASSTSSTYQPATGGAYAAKMLPQQPTSASPAPQTYYPSTGRHYATAGDQIVPGGASKYSGPSPSQSAMIMGKSSGQGLQGSSASLAQQQTTQPGLRTELHPLPSTEPLR